MKSHFRYATRLNSMKARPDLYTWRSGRVDLRGMLERMDLIKGLDGLYINYPEHFVGDNKAMISDWLAMNGSSVRSCPRARRSCTCFHRTCASERRFELSVR